MKQIILHGEARKRFGGPFLLDVATPMEAIRFLIRLVPGFEAYLKGHEWKIIRGPKATGTHCDIDRLKATFGRVMELHIAPIPAGAKRAGLGKVILGVVIMVIAVAAAIWTGGSSLGVGAALEGTIGGTGVTFGSVALFGASLILSGVATMLTATPSSGDPNDRETNKASFIFAGPVNVVQEGQPIPLVYGKRIRVGSVVGSAGIFSEDVTG